MFSFITEYIVRYTGPRNRVSRRFQANLFSSPRNPLLHKPNAPGQHGAKRKKKSDFGLQLDEQQKLKAVYGMLTKHQLTIAFKRALETKGVTAHLFLENLECRLDNLVFRLRIAPTIFAAQQLVTHGHIQVDGKKVDRRSYIVRPGQVISVRPKSREMKLIQESITMTARELPSYLELEEGNLSGKLIASPAPDQVPLPIQINIPLVCEFLAHTT